MNLEDIKNNGEQLAEKTNDLIIELNKIEPKNDLSFINQYVKKIDDEKRSSQLLELAEIQINLSKNIDYWIDLDELNKNLINELVKEIVLLSLTLINTIPKYTISYSQSYHTHEDKACVLGPLGNRYCHNGNLIKNGWPDLSIIDAVNFEFTPKPITLSSDDQLIRVISNNGNKNGHWWLRKNLLPPTKKEWCSDFAVSKNWNKGDTSQLVLEQGTVFSRAREVNRSRCSPIQRLMRALIIIKMKIIL